MQRFGVFVAIAMFLAQMGVAHARRTRAVECRAACGNAIQRCTDDGGVLKKCKKSVIKRCRRDGTAYCADPPPPLAGPFHVAPAGADDAACGPTTAPCRSIQYVVDNLIALGGAGVIKLAGGTYDQLAVCPTGAIPNQAVVCILNKQIQILGGFTPPNWDTTAGAESIIDGQDSGRGIRIQRTGASEPAASIELRDVIVQHGLAQGKSSGTNDETYAFGGGIFSEHSQVTLRNVTLRNNRVIGGTTTQTEGGRSAGGGLAMNDDTWSAATGTGTLENVTFEANESRGGAGANEGGDAHGGALFVYGATLTGTGLTFDGNTATAGLSNGNGYHGYEKSDALGGAVSAEQGSTVTLQNVTARNNLAQGGHAPNGEAGGGFGGAFFGELATFTLTDALVQGNAALGGNGQNAQTSSSLAEGGGIHADHTTLTLARVRVIANTASSGNGGAYSGAVAGGGVAITFGKSVTYNTNAPYALTNVIIADNTVDIGTGTLVGGGAGGLWIQSSVGTIDHATIAGNHLADNRLLGGGIALIANDNWTTGATIRNAIIANHTDAPWHPSVYGTAAVYAAQNTTATLTRALFANNVHDSNAGISGGLNLPAGTIYASGSLSSGNAGFVSPGGSNHNYHLTSGSPARDQASGSTTTDDVDGNARPQGGVADIGADEYWP